MMKRVISILCMVLVLLPTAVFSQGGKIMDIERKTYDIERRCGAPAAEMLGEAAKLIKPEIVASKIRKNEMTAYGFTAGTQTDKDFFRLGIAVANMEAALLTGDRTAIASALDDLEGLAARIGFSSSLIEALRAVRAAMDKGNPVAGPFSDARKQIDGLADEKKMLDFLRFGEWSGTSYLLLSAGKDGEGDVAKAHMGKYNQAGVFLSALKDKGLPKGVTDALGELKGFESMSIGIKEIRRAIVAFDTIINIMAG